jgi:aminopeptidase N
MQALCPLAAFRPSTRLPPFPMSIGAIAKTPEPSLKRSMTWDEEVYGREYDLDVFNIVAVDDFNMGAMENKGLNIFNSKYVLASPETATDRDLRFHRGDRRA